MPPVAPWSTSAKRLRRQAPFGERAAGRLPRAAGELADRGARVGVADDDELPRLLVLRARCVGRGAEHGGDVVVGDGSVGERAVRALAGDDVEEVGARFRHVLAPDARERVDVHDAQLRVERPALPRVGARVADPVADERRHGPVRRFGIVGVHLVEVHEARIAAGRVLERRDHRVAGYADLGDVADVHEVAPVPQLLRAIGILRRDEHEREPDGRVAGDHALAGARRATEVVAGDVGRVSRAARIASSTS